MKIGITERGDPGFDLSWAGKLFAANIIITKQLRLSNKAFINAILQNKDKIILHVGCTGFGGTVVEPNVPHPQEVKNAVMYLLENSFPVSQTVLRIDPIIPTAEGLLGVKNVLELFRDTGIKRVRVSILDLYPHVRIRFAGENLQLPYPRFTASYEQFRNTEKVLNEFQDIYSFEACAEPNLQIGEKIGCISPKDLDILNVKYDANNIDSSGYQRNTCLCPSGKTELLSLGRKQCPSGCLYCYWKG